MYHIKHESPSIYRLSWCGLFKYYTLGFDFNTSGNICPIVFWFVDTIVHYTLIIQSFPKNLWCVIWVTLSMVPVVNCRNFWQCGTHDFYTTGSNVLPHISSALVFFFFLQYWFFCAFKTQNINMGKPTPHILYPHMPPQTHTFCCRWKSLDL